MRISWHDVWGCARGPVRRLAPQTRLLAGAAAFAVCMIVPAATARGSFVAIATAGLWLVLCRPPLRLLSTTLAFGLALFLPYFLLLPIIPDNPSGGYGSAPSALVVPWTILLRGICGTLVAVGTAASLTAGDLREGLVRLPVPRVVSAILVQIIHQAGTLIDESGRIASAMAVRGASRRGVLAWRVLASLPRVWLPRVIARAERVAQVMELRGYCDGSLGSLQRIRTGVNDAAALAVALLVLTLAIVLRVRGAA